MTPFALLLFAWAPCALAGGNAQVEVLAGGRTAPQLTAQGPAELTEAENPGALMVVRADAESGSWKGAWLGSGAEAWGYLPDPDFGMLRLEPRGGWSPDTGEHWNLDLGARYALEAYPWSPTLSSARGEATAAAGPTLGPLRLAVDGGYVRRDFFGNPTWSFQAAELGLRAQSAKSSGGFRASVKLSGQYNSGFTVDGAGGSHPATGTQARARLALGWTRRSVDLNLGWNGILAWEGNVEDAARPQFTPIGQYADDADVLSAGGFLQNRVDLSAGWLPGRGWSLGLNGMLRLRLSETGQASASLATTLHLQARVERELGKKLTVLATTGMTQVDMVTGASALDVYGWAGLRWRLPESSKEQQGGDEDAAD